MKSLLFEKELIFFDIESIKRYFNKLNVIIDTLINTDILLVKTCIQQTLTNLKFGTFRKRVT